MVSINKDLNAAPAPLLDAKWAQIRQDVLITQNAHAHKTSCYRDTTIEELKTLYKNKCAFCERVYGDELEVDHYRPKKERSVAKDRKHDNPGYYWLSYEWSNLILCCSKCNGQKSNKFPLTGLNELNRVSTHIVNPGIPNYDSYDFQWIQVYENPLLLNPESDINFETHLRYMPSGEVKGITDKGKLTIEICDLNRSWLLNQRQKIIDEYIVDINDSVDDYSRTNNRNELKGSLKNTFKRIQKHTQSNYPFSLYHNYISMYFKFHIGSKLEVSIRDTICSYWLDYKNSLD